MSFTAISAKVYNAQLLNGILPEEEKTLRKVRMTFAKRNVQLQNSNNSFNYLGVRVKNFKSTLLILDLP